MWDVKSTIAQGRPVLLHRCPVEPFGKHNFFKWSHDDKYVAIGKSKYLRSPETGEVSDYSLDKRLVRVENHLVSSLASEAWP